MVQYIRKKEVLKIFDKVLENLDMDKDSLVEMNEVYDAINILKEEIEKL